MQEEQCEYSGVGEVRGEKVRDGGMEGWIEGGGGERRGTGKTGFEGSSLLRRMLGSDGFQVVASEVEELS